MLLLSNNKAGRLGAAAAARYICLRQLREWKRTHYCGEITESDISKEVTVFGWVQRQRDLGQLIFIDLRDRTGIVQLSFDDSTDRDVFDKAWHMRSEYVAGRTRRCYEARFG